MGAQPKSQFEFKTAAGGSEGDATIIHTTVPKRVGGYELLEMLGEGGMGAIFLARHLKLGRRVALKLIRLDLLSNPDVIKRFEREMLTIGSLHHPNVLLAYDAGIDAGYPFLATELVDGVDAQNLIENEGRLSIGNSVEIVRQALLGIAHAASRDIVHRDLKPANLLIDTKGIVKVADLGVARLNDAKAETLTATNLIIGTPDFLSPEQARGDWDVTTSADIYSLGCTLFNLLTGEKPFSGNDYDTPLKKVRAHEETQAPPVTDYRSDLPDELVEILNRMMAKDPLVRGEDPALIAEQLKKFDEGADLPPIVHRVSEKISKNAKPIRVTWITPATNGSVEIDNREMPGSPSELVVETARKERRQKRRRIWLSAGLALLAIGGTAGALSLGKDDNPLPKEPPAEVEEGLPHFSKDSDLGYPIPISLERARINDFGNATRPASMKIERDRISLISPQSTLLELATLDSADFTLTFDLHQAPWNGNCGIFVASKKGIDEDTPAQLVMMAEIYKKEKQPFVLWAAELQAKQDTAGIIHYSVKQHAEERMERKGADISFEIEYRDGRLHAVRIDNDLIPFAPQKLGPHQIRGEVIIGLFATGTSFTASDPRIQVTTEEVDP